MARYEVFVLRIWRNRALCGQQWAAHLERLPGGPSWRFRSAERLLAHLAAELGGDAAEPAEYSPAADAPGMPWEGGASDAGQS